MTKRSWTVLSSAALLWGTACAQQPDALDADAVVSLAYARNGEFLALNQNIREREALLRQAGVRPAPTLEIEGSTGRPLGTSGEEEYSAGYFQPFERGGKKEKRTSVARLAVELSRAEIAERARQLTIEVESRYAEAVAAQQKLETVQALLQIDRENYELTNARVRAGDAAPLEAALFLADVNKARAQQLIFQARLATALAELRRVVGLASQETFNIRFAFSPGLLLPLEELRRRALDRPDLRSLRITERQMQAGVELAIAQGKADVTGSVRYSLRNSGFDQRGLDATGAAVPLRDRDNVLAFGVSIPLFAAGRNRGNVNAAGAREAAARQRRQFLESTIPAEIESASRRLENADEVVALLSSGVLEQSENNLRVIREAYYLGQLRALDVLNQQRLLAEARLSSIDAQLEREQARIELERAIGGRIR